MVVYGIFALSATARSAVQIVRDFDRAPLAYVLSALAALTYIAMTIILVKRPWANRLILSIVVIELVGVITVGFLSRVMPELFPDATVWSGFGEGYGFVPLILPLVAGVLSAQSLGSENRRPRERE